MKRKESLPKQIGFVQGPERPAHGWKLDGRSPVALVALSLGRELAKSGARSYLHAKSCISFAAYQGNCLAANALAMLKCGEEDFDICANVLMMQYECLAEEKRLSIGWRKSAPYPTLSMEEGLDKLCELVMQLKLVDPTPARSFLSALASTDLRVEHYVQESRLAMARYAIKASRALAFASYEALSFCEAAKWFRRVLDIHESCLRWYSATGGWNAIEREANATVGAATRRCELGPRAKHTAWANQIDVNTEPRETIKSLIQADLGSRKDAVQGVACAYVNELLANSTRSDMRRARIQLISMVQTILVDQTVLEKVAALSVQAATERTQLQCMQLLSTLPSYSHKELWSLQYAIAPVLKHAANLQPSKETKISAHSTEYTAAIIKFFNHAFVFHPQAASQIVRHDAAALCVDAVSSVSADPKLVTMPALICLANLAAHRQWRGGWIRGNSTIGLPPRILRESEASVQHAVSVLDQNLLRMDEPHNIVVDEPLSVLMLVPKSIVPTDANHMNKRGQKVLPTPKHKTTVKKALSRNDSPTVDTEVVKPQSKDTVKLKAVKGVAQQTTVTFFVLAFVCAPAAFAGLVWLALRMSVNKTPPRVATPPPKPRERKAKQQKPVEKLNSSEVKVEEVRQQTPSPNRKSKAEKKRRAGQVGATPCPSPVAAKRVQAEAKAVGAQDSEESTECVVCQDQQKEAAFFPCGHKCVCIQCAMLLAARTKPECPICRARVQGYARIYE